MHDVGRRKYGVVTMEAQGIERLFKKRMGRDDRQFIAYSSIQFVEYNRKRVGRDVVISHVGGSRSSGRYQMVGMERFEPPTLCSQGSRPKTR